MGGARKSGKSNGQGDLDLWRHIAEGVRPLKKRDTPVRPETQDAPPKSASKKVAAQPQRRSAAAEPPPPPAPPLSAGAIVGVDRRTAERMKRGVLPIDGRLDLHGLTQREAHDALGEFLSAAEARGNRCVLVITGKGRESGGVLRAEVPRWLNEPANRARILAFAETQPKHGGAGALYVLLRRRRSP